MQDETGSSNASSPQGGAQPPAAAGGQQESRAGQGAGRPRRRRWWMLAGVATAIAGLAACAQSGRANDGAGYGWHQRGHGGPMDPETVARRIDRGVQWVLSDVDATPDQKQKVSDIAKAAAADLAPLRDRHRAARKRAVEILSAPSVDRAALETVRADELSMAEGASRRLTQALADMADVLTPEQRVKLREKAERRMGRRWG